MQPQFYHPEQSLATPGIISKYFDWSKSLNTRCDVAWISHPLKSFLHLLVWSYYFCLYLTNFFSSFKHCGYRNVCSWVQLLNVHRPSQRNFLITKMFHIFLPPHPLTPPPDCLWDIPFTALSYYHCNGRCQCS